MEIQYIYQHFVQVSRIGGLSNEIVFPIITDRQGLSASRNLSTSVSQPQSFCQLFLSEEL